ncbi:MAG: LacI family DNA-binding transcriptional regulator, partial [Chloroflexota bacterium]
MPKQLQESTKAGVTLKDIAEAVGKSVTAVSRALNDHADIGVETRNHIKQVAREMGYTPNLMARRLQKQTTDTLGFILPVLSPRDSDPYFSELLVGITNEAKNHGYDLLVSTCAPGAEETQTYKRLMSSSRIDGMIVARPRWQDDRLDLLADKQFPFVIIGDSTAPETQLAVIDEVAEGAKLATRHLIDQGHTQIALINTPAELHFSNHYLTGFRA